MSLSGVATVLAGIPGVVRSTGKQIDIVTDP